MKTRLFQNHLKAVVQEYGCQRMACRVCGYSYSGWKTAKSGENPRVVAAVRLAYIVICLRRRNKSLHARNAELVRRVAELEQERAA